MNSILNSAILHASRKLNVDYKLVEQIYMSYWSFIKNHLSGISIKEMSPEEFNSTHMNFNIPYIGKLFADPKKFQSYKHLNIKDNASD